LQTEGLLLALGSPLGGPVFGMPYLPHSLAPGNLLVLTFERRLLSLPRSMDVIPRLHLFVAGRRAGTLPPRIIALAEPAKCHLISEMRILIEVYNKEARKCFLRQQSALKLADVERLAPWGYSLLNVSPGKTSEDGHTGQ
jgi:hypothetical protein